MSEQAKPDWTNYTTHHTTLHNHCSDDEFEGLGHFESARNLLNPGRIMYRGEQMINVLDSSLGK